MSLRLQQAVPLRAYVGWPLFRICAGLLGLAILSVLVTFYTHRSEAWIGVGLHAIFYLLAVPSFFLLLVAPIALLVVLGLEVALPVRQISRTFGYISLLLTALLFNPITAPGLLRYDMDYAQAMFERAETLKVVGRSKAEVVALLGQPDYVLPSEHFPGEEQLRYHHRFVLPFADAEFLVHIENGQAAWIYIDPD